MNELQRLMPRAARRTNQVYTTTEALVFPDGGASYANVDGVSFINDNAQLEDFIAQCKGADKIAKAKGVGGLLHKALSASSITLPFLKVDLAKWNLQNQVTSTALAKFQYVLLREDQLQDIRISELLELYCGTPPLQQPQIVFVKSDTASTLHGRLRYASSRIAIVNIQRRGPQPLIVERTDPSSLSDFSDLYESRCFDIVARASPLRIHEWYSTSARLPEAFALGTRVRARLLTAERHDVETDVDALLRRIESMAAAATGVEIEALLYMRTTALLQKLFCSEDPRHLTEAIALASAIGDEVGLASCLRYAEFLDVHPALAEHMYRRAERTFRTYGILDAALYTANNRLISSFTRRLEDAHSFDDLLAEIRDGQPALYRRHDILYNSGVRHLLAGHIDKAAEVFEDPELAHSRPLVIASALLGKLVCQQLSGSVLAADEAIDLATYVTNMVPPSNRWHVTNLLLNLLVLIGKESSTYDDVRHIAEPRIDLSERMDVRDIYGENRRLAAIVNFGAATVQRIPGPFGDFQDRTGLAVPYYFIWS